MSQQRKIELKHSVVSSDHTKRLARAIPSLNGIPVMFTVLGILYKLAELCREAGTKVSTREYLFSGKDFNSFDKVIGIEGFSAKAEGIVSESEDGIIINSSFFLEDKEKVNQVAHRKLAADRQRRYRANRKVTPTPITNTTPVQTTLLADPIDEKPLVDVPKTEKKKTIKKEDRKPPEEPHYRTYKWGYITGEHLVMWNMFWKAWGTYGNKSKAGDPFLLMCKKSVIRPDNIKMICAAATYDAGKREMLKGQHRTPIYPQGWLSGVSWELYEDLLKSGKINVKSAGEGKLEDLFPHDWKRILSKVIWADFPDLIGKLEGGHYKEIWDLTDRLKKAVLKYET